MSRVLGHKCFGQVYAERVGQHTAILFIGVMTRAHVALLDEKRHTIHLCGSVVTPVSYTHLTQPTI